MLSNDECGLPFPDGLKIVDWTQPLLNGSPISPANVFSETGEVMTFDVSQLVFARPTCLDNGLE